MESARHDTSKSCLGDVRGGQRSCIHYGYFVLSSMPYPQEPSGAQEKMKHSTIMPSGMSLGGSCCL